MKLYNSYTNQTEEFEPIKDNKVSMYVCGPTVYDYAHLGHARCYITWDMVVRYLRFRGYDVTYARNITDVDDKIIKKAKEQNTTPEAIAAEFYQEFKNSMDALNCVSPDIEPMATKTIGEMIGLIKKLEAKGFAYAVDGDVYFRVPKFDDYGKLSNQKIEDLESGARIEADERKESPLDFALWKAVKDDDEISWKSPWGKGRPGWHLECSAMINKVFKGEPIDIHAGGQDLLFPHHENEIAQSACAYGNQFVKYWMHNGFVTINNEKMSKSLGNFTTINELLKTYDANTIRYFILTNHYRMPVGFNDEALQAAQAGVRRIKNAIDDGATFLAENIEAISLYEKNTSVQAFIEAMDNDFNTSKAMSILFDLASNANKAKDEGDKEVAKENIGLLLLLSETLGFDFKAQKAIDYEQVKLALLGFVKSDEVLSKAFLGETFNQATPPPDDHQECFEYSMNLLTTIRNKAREAKKWEISDQIRDGLANVGIALKDTKDGTTWSVE